MVPIRAQLTQKLSSLPILNTLIGEKADRSRGQYALLPTLTSASSRGSATNSHSSSTSPTLARRHRRQLSISSFSAHKATWGLLAILLLLLLGYISSTSSLISHLHPPSPSSSDQESDIDDTSYIPTGQSRQRDGREMFWWEQYPILSGYWTGRKSIKPAGGYAPQFSALSASSFEPGSRPEAIVEVGVPLIESKVVYPNFDLKACGVTAPRVKAYQGLQAEWKPALLGSMSVMGIDEGMCYERAGRLGAYGLGMDTDLGGLGIELHGDKEDWPAFTTNWTNVKFGQVQRECVQQNEAVLATIPRTAFVLRTWHTFEYTPHAILWLRALISELSLRSRGQINVHFLIHVQDESLPIWTSKEEYERVLAESLPAEFAGMGTLWSIPQMKEVYPGPFPDSMVNFSGAELFTAYRSLHLAMQYFALQHEEYDYFWQWETDMRVTGDYGYLINHITAWADAQPDEWLWERNAQYFVPGAHNGSYAQFSQAVIDQAKAEGKSMINGPQMPESRRLPSLLYNESQPPATRNMVSQNNITDLITLNPMFDPTHTKWAFHEDITGYGDLTPTEEQLDSNKAYKLETGPYRPPTRAALITASRLSRRLLVLMHHEVLSKHHTMFPEMFPASIAFQYGLRAVYAPITIYFDRDWPVDDVEYIFNNKRLDRPEQFTAGMDHGNRYFHGEGGSVFGPGEHVFRGSSWYANGGFSGYLWRRWLGEERRPGDEESDLERGRVCLPMMVLHPVKSDA